MIEISYVIEQLNIQTDFVLTQYLVKKNDIIKKKSIDIHQAI